MHNRDDEEYRDLKAEEESDKAFDEIHAAKKEAIADMSNLDKIRAVPPELIIDSLCEVLKANPDVTVEDLLNNDFNGKTFTDRFYMITVDLNELDFTEIDEHLYQEGL